MRPITIFSAILLLTACETVEIATGDDYYRAIAFLSKVTLIR